MIVDGRNQRSDLSLQADLCVVGSGAGGAMMAREAARAGLRVVVLEEGPRSEVSDFSQREDEMIPRLFQEAGGRTTTDGAITVLQGRGIGGSTVHNTNLCKRAAKEVLDSWNLPGWRSSDLAPHYAVVERDLDVAPIEESRINRNNALLRRGVEKLGWRGGVLSHNRRDCLGAGFCELGCPFDRKQDARKVLIPEAIAAGARVFADCRAKRVIHDDKRVLGVEGRMLDEEGRLGPKFSVRSQAVCLSASAVGSAVLALESVLPDPAGSIGRGLHLHPGVAVAGVFDEVIEGWLGIPQSYECTEKLRFDENAGDDRVWILPAFAHPIGMASALPGFGPEHMRRMRLYPKLGVFVAMLHDQTEGQVTIEKGEKGRPMLHYRLSSADERALLHGLAACAELLFAAGARRVLVPFSSPLELESSSQIAKIKNHVYRPLDPLLTAVHPMGTLALGRVVDERGAWRGLEGAWVADGSLFPTSLGGPPQLTIYASAHKVAGELVKSLR